MIKESLAAATLIVAVLLNARPASAKAENGGVLRHQLKAFVHAVASADIFNRSEAKSRSATAAAIAPELHRLKYELEKLELNDVRMISCHIVCASNESSQIMIMCIYTSFSVSRSLFSLLRVSLSLMTLLSRSFKFFTISFPCSFCIFQVPVLSVSLTLSILRACVLPFARSHIHRTMQYQSTQAPEPTKQSRFEHMQSPWKQHQHQTH